jgi:hypothetical protein
MTAGAVHRVARNEWSRPARATTRSAPHFKSDAAILRPISPCVMATQAVTAQRDVQEAGRPDPRQSPGSAGEVWVRLNGMPPNCLAKATGHGPRAAVAPHGRSPNQLFKMLSRFNLPADMRIGVRPHEMCGG